MFNKRKHQKMQNVIDKRRAFTIADAELKTAYAELYSEMGYTPEQVSKMVK